MDLALVERLMCPRPHAATPLVVRADDVADGTLVRGVVGCPVCFAEWPVREGALEFGVGDAGPAVTPPDAATAAALLSLSEPGRLVLIDGASPQLVAELAADFGAIVVALDAPPLTPASVRLNGAELVPLAVGVVRGALLLRPSRSAAFVESAVRAVAGGGRIAGTASLATPRDVNELARDERLWVGERVVVTAPVALRRASG